MNAFINLSPQQLSQSIAKEAAETYSRLAQLLELHEKYIAAGSQLDPNSPTINDDMYEATWNFWKEFAVIYKLPDLKHDAAIMQTLADHYNRITGIQNVKDETTKEPS